MGNASLWSRLTRSRDEAEAAELQRELGEAATSSIGSCHPGEQVMVAGTVRSVTIRPPQEPPALEIELYDGTGSVSVVWMGRRRIPGIDPGRRMVIWGRLTCSMEQPRIFNPRYELKPSVG